MVAYMIYIYDKLINEHKMWLRLGQIWRRLVDSFESLCKRVVLFQKRSNPNDLLKLLFNYI